jgi:hypothetical protein
MILWPFCIYHNFPIGSHQYQHKFIQSGVFVLDQVVNVARKNKRTRNQISNDETRLLFYKLFILEVGLTTPFIPLFVPITPSSFRLRNRCKEWVHKGGGVRLNFANRHNYGLASRGLMIFSISLEKINIKEQNCEEGLFAK